MKILIGALHVIDLVNEWIGNAVSVLILALMVLVVEGVTARYFLRSPHSWTLETCGFILLIIVTLGGGYTLLHGGHVKVDILYSKLSTRTKAIMDLFTYTFVFAVAVVLFIYGGRAFLMAFTTQATSFSGWQVILWPFRLCIPVAGFLLGLQALAKWIRDLVTVITGKPLESGVVAGEGGIRS